MPTAERVAADRRDILGVWLVTRMTMVIVALGVTVATGGRLADVVGHWDIRLWLDIGRDGYADERNMAFFPGWPLVLKLLGAIGGGEAGAILLGSLVAMACSLVAAAALYRLAGRWGTIAWLLAPTAVFTAVPYTEAPFCAAAFWAWERATRRQWGQAAVLAAVACTLRVSGLFLIGALAILAVTQGRHGAGARLAWLLLPTAVLAGYVTYLYGLTGSWTAWFAAQEAGWNRGFHWPWESLRNHWNVLWRPTPDHPEWVWVFRAEMIAWLVGLVATLVALARRRLAEAGWVGVQVVAFSLSYWLMSVTRAVLLWFPLWRQLDDLAEAKRGSRGWRVAAWVAGLLGFAAQITWAWLFFTGRWSS